jgi:hypothetical protein
VVGACQFDEWFAGFGLNIGCVDHRETPQSQALSGDEAKDVEGVYRDSLIVLVVGDHPTAHVGREYLGGKEMVAGECALARAAGADEYDKT